MESARLKKVNRLLQKELGIYFQQNTKTLFNGAMITVTDVSASPDLSSAKIYISLFLTSDTKMLFKTITELTPLIRKSLGNAVKSQLRVIPELQFKIDDSLDKAMRIDELLKK
ncbi:MAG: 30S ribosome-binding factor RbfA [Bacteroidia bacterium]|nr:30S ribosome-binding factor RbfA [Bacteroidia bacterium]